MLGKVMWRTLGVYPPQEDTWLLREVLRRELHTGSQVLELCTGSGALAINAARYGASEVTAIDISRRALTVTWLRARHRRVRVRLHRGDLTGPVRTQRFDLIACNPPYVPSEDDTVPYGGRNRCVDGGTDGRMVVDRVCAETPELLHPGGTLLLMHSALCGVSTTVRMLARHGLTAEVAARCEAPFGPIMRQRAEWLAARGFIHSSQRTEELVVIRARKPA
jgi:release factor glutamine methyltransferase